MAYLLELPEFWFNTQQQILKSDPVISSIMKIERRYKDPQIAVNNLD
jgi:hypothetical protein